MRFRISLLFVMVGAIAGCLFPGTSYSEDPPRWAAPPLSEAVAVRDGRSGELVSLEALYDALAAADVVFLGETHTDETTHRVELAVYQALLERRENRVVLAMEMFERDVQPHLDAYLQGEIDEPAFLAKSRPWGNYRTGYRPLIEQAKAARLPVVASNFPRPLMSSFRGGGNDPLADLTEAQKKLVPRQYFPNREAYWRRVDNATRGHVGMMPTGDAQSRLYSVQSLWDNAMGEACADALDAHPNHVVLHVNGGFHSAYWDGTVHQLKLRKPDAHIKTVSIVPATNPPVVDVEGKPVADYVVMAEARATDLNDGTWSVYTDQEVKYRLHMPQGAQAGQPVPLLIWLGDDGFTASDGLELWKDRLGEQVAIAVLDAPYRETQGDFSIGGRWYWADSFPADIYHMVVAVERTWAYLLRHYPIDPQRVCVAGEGAGATVVTGVALQADRMQLHGLAVMPSRYAKLKDLPLPLAELAGDPPPPVKSLQVIGTTADRDWWESELAQYTEQGITSTFASRDGDPWSRELQEENAIRKCLALDLAPPPSSKTRRYLLVSDDVPRQRHWARLQALWAAAESGEPVAVVDAVPDSPAAPIATKITPEQCLAEGVLPRCPGSFGGSTILVVPAAELERWLVVEENDPLGKVSRMFRVRVATVEPGEHSLATVVRKVNEENRMRKNFLIVPALFCADSQLMQQCKRSLRDLENEMTFHWLAGLGGRKISLGATPSAATDLPVKHSLVVKLDPGQHRINVTDLIELPASLRDAGTEFTLASDLEITSSSPAVEKVGPEPTRDMTRYRLAAPPGDEHCLELKYEGKLHHELSAQEEEYTRGFRETQGYIGPDGVYLDGGSGWVPHFNDQLIQFTVQAELPADWHIISQGGGTSRDGGDRARWDSDLPLEQVYLVGGPLHRYVDVAGTTEALVFLREQDEALARKYLDATAQYIEMYRSLIGPYPYDKFALVENFWETGYGMPSFTLLGPQVIRFPFILHSSYPHEILHNWWGNSVFVDYESGNWCEGLTAYMADHLVQEQRGLGSDYRRNTLQKYRNYVRQSRDFPLTEFRERHSAATEAVGYGKSLMLFHMLRRQLGDDVFRRALARFYDAQKGKRAGFDDLRREFEAAGECDLAAFFDQWTRRTGAPLLKLENVGVTRSGEQYEITGTMVQAQSGGPYLLQVPVEVQTAAGVTSTSLSSATERTEFSIAVDSQPLALHVDPAFDLFRLLDPRETPASIGQIFGEASIVAVIPSQAPASLQEAYRKLIAAWKSDSHAIEVVLDNQLKSLPADRGVWVLGRENRFAPDLADPSAGASDSLNKKAIRLGDESVAYEHHCVVLIRRHPENMEKAVGLLVVDPPNATAGLARKLPHYGKYSYLAFEGEEPTNVVKGQWTASGSPLVVDLRAARQAALAELKLPAREALAELPAVFSSQSLMEHVAWLAAPEREGRGLGSAGLSESARYIADAMVRCGLEPGGDDGTYFQKFTVERGPDGKPAEALNVVGILPGNKASWSDQSLVLGAHYDHLGFGWPDVRAAARGKLHPGADDNASGVAVMLELARNLASQGGGSRNLVCVAFSAEECGRWGSKYYLQHPALPREGIRGVINLDTVGRLFDGKIAIHATGTADEWQHIFRGCGFVTGIPNQIVPGSEEGSDQMSFIEQGIPAVQVFTGAHEDYHSPRDTVEAIDAAGLVKVATFVKEAVVYMLDRELPLTVTIAGSQQAETKPAAPAQSGRRVLVGTVPAFDYQGPGVKIDSFTPDSPAANSQLQKGDVIVRIDDQPVESLRGYSDLLRKLEPNQTIEIEVMRSGQKVRVKLTVVQR